MINSNTKAAIVSRKDRLNDYEIYHSVCSQHSDIIVETLEGVTYDAALDRVMDLNRRSKETLILRKMGSVQSGLFNRIF